MSVEKEVGSQKGNHTSSPRNISVDAYETNLKETAHKLNEKESLSAWLTILASGFGLISDGCNFYILCSRRNQLNSRVPDQNNLMTMSNVGHLSSIRRQFSIVLSRSSSRHFTLQNIHRPYPPKCQMLFLSVGTL